MKRLLLAAALAASSFAAAAPASAASYDIDPTHTQVQFTYSHFGFLNITGRFDQVSGTFDFDPANPTASSIEVEIPVSSISTGVEALDEHLQRDDFFDVAQFPTASFRSTSVEAAGEGQLKVAGDLTIHGVTAPMVLDVTINGVGNHPMKGIPAAGFDATATISRTAFGVGKYAPAVGDEVTLRITLEATATQAE